MIVAGRDDSIFSMMYQERHASLLPSVTGTSLEEIEVFTHQQIQAIREHRYGSHREEIAKPRKRHRETGSLHELLATLAGWLAKLGKRDRDELRPVRPAQ